MPAMPAIRTLNADDAKYLASYIRELANRMRLADWQIKLVLEPAPSDNAIAECDWSNGRHTLSIWLCLEFRELPVRAQRHAIVHELLHAHFSRPWDTLKYLYESGNISTAVYEAVGKESVRNFEHAIDAVAEIIAESMPYPPWQDMSPRSDTIQLAPSVLPASPLGSTPAAVTTTAKKTPRKPATARTKQKGR